MDLSRDVPPPPPPYDSMSSSEGRIQKVRSDKLTQSKRQHSSKLSQQSYAEYFEFTYLMETLCWLLHLDCYYIKFYSSRESLKMPSQLFFIWKPNFSMKPEKIRVFYWNIFTSE